MKRCPQCEFIYEDDQSLCDMDGALLVLDSRSLLNLHALAPIDVPAVSKPHWRHRTFPAMAALILATVLSLVYFVSSQRSAQIPAPIPISAPAIVTPSSTTAASDANQVPPIAPLEVNAAAVATKDKEEPKTEPAKNTTKRVPAPGAKKSATNTTTPERKPAEPKKDDSKVGSILKKTGQILKKPFKL